MQFRNEEEAKVGLDWINKTFNVFDYDKCTLEKNKFNAFILVIPEKVSGYNNAINNALSGLSDLLTGYRLGKASNK